MEEAEYKKYKDQRPEDTIYRIQTILHKIGLTTVCEWEANEYDGCYSNHITVYPTELGTNGKGTDRMYTMASGYAELMERIQNQMLYCAELSPEDLNFGGFQYYPDEKTLSIDELIMQGDPFMEHFFQELGCVSEADKTYALERYLESRNGLGDLLLCIPYADLDAERIVYLPADIMVNTCGSNGMAAGNTREEALVQGLSEIFERYANRRIALEHICPPSVPREVLARIPSLYRIICEIEKDPAYRVEIKDCSLGRGLPVAAILIINRNTGSFGVKFSSHPSFSIALERALTEAFQGKSLEVFTSFNHTGTDEKVRNRDNLINIMKIGNGFYPKEFLSLHPDYSFDPDLLLVQRNNTEMLEHMLALVRQEGYHPLIHDVSYLGFHSYSIVVPGMSDMYPTDWQRFREIMTSSLVAGSFGRLSALTEEETDRVLRYMKFKENSMLENQLQFIFRRPLTDKMPGGLMATDVMKAMLLYQRGKFREAAAQMNAVLRYFEDTKDKEKTLFCKCCLQYMIFRAEGCSAKESTELTGRLFPEGISRRVSEILADENSAMKQLYPAAQCYDCEHCGMEQKGYCSYRRTVAEVRKIKAAMAEHIPDQKELLNLEGQQ